MTGAGRLGGRGVAVAKARIPSPVAVDPLILPFRLVTVLAAQLFDFGTFTVMVARHGIAAELNPLVAHAYAGFGMPMVGLLKLTLVVFLASTVVLLERDGPGHRARPGVAATIVVLAVVAGLVGGISNAIAT